MANASFTELNGNTIIVNTDEVCAIRPVPANLLPVAIAAGTYIDHESGARYSVTGTVAATLVTLAASGWRSAALTDLNGVAVHAAPSLVSGILALPASVLPPAVADGTAVEFDQATALKVAGTVAAVTALLAAAEVSGNVLAIARVDWAAGTPSFDVQQGFTGAIVDNGPGDCTLTLTASGAAGEAVPVLTPLLATAAIITFIQPSGSTIRVTTFDAAGAALDNVPFSIVVHAIAT